MPKSYTRDSLEMEPTAQIRRPSTNDLLRELVQTLVGLRDDVQELQAIARRHLSVVEDD